MTNQRKRRQFCSQFEFESSRALALAVAQLSHDLYCYCLIGEHSRGHEPNAWAGTGRTRNDQSPSAREALRRIRV
ncbi:hypothetical protein N7501_004679 [Penicillium viridicatum]|nr:hypothetical protein N7501_004679 [Penicillium viridicatum]